MNSDEDLAYVLWSKTRKYTLYWLFHLQLQIIMIVKVGKTMQRKGRGLLLMAPDEKQSKPPSLPMASFWCFF